MQLRTRVHDLYTPFFLCNDKKLIILNLLISASGTVFPCCPCTNKKYMSIGMCTNYIRR